MKHYDFERVGRDDDFGIFEIGARAHYIAACQDCREAERIVRALNLLVSWEAEQRDMIAGLVFATKITWEEAKLSPPSLNEHGPSSPNP